MKPAGIFYLTLASLNLAVYTVILKDALNKGIDPLSYLAGILLIGIAISVLYLSLNKKDIKQKIRKDLINFLILGFGGIFLGRMLFVVGTNYTTAINAGFLVKLTVVTTMIFAFFILKERISKKAIYGTIIAILGLFFLTTGISFSTPNFGDILIIFLVIIIGFTNILAKILMSDFSPYFISAVRMLIGGLILLAFILIILGGQTFTAINIAFWHVLFGGITSTLFIFFLYMGIDIEGPSISTAFFLLSAVFTVLFAYMYLNETLDLVQYIGAGLLFAGLYLVARSK